MDMSNMRPEELPDEVRNEPFRLSEIIFFDAAKKLPKHWYVLYGVTWYLRIRNNSWSEGEADFVLVSPEIGVVVVEVKGGKIGRDENGWYSIDRNGEKHIIKDPALQASNGKHKLLTVIKNNSFFENRFIPSRHMVCFPNISECDAPRLIDIPREMQILSEDFDKLEKHIIEFAKRNYEQNIPPLSNADCLKIANIIKPNFTCPSKLSIQVKRQNKSMSMLTQEQSSIWDMITDNPRVAISGPAGSGKTLLALKFIQKYIEEDKKVLILVPSKSLKEYYQVSLENSTNIRVAIYDNYTDDYVASFNNIDYDLVVIDEAQDLSDDNWISIYSCYNIVNSHGLVCVFDSNQKLRSKGAECPLESLLRLKLSKVIRNTKQIAQFSTLFYKGDIGVNNIGPDGIDIQFTEVHNENDMVTEIVKSVRHYVIDEGFEFSDIVVLYTGSKDLRVALKNSKAYGITFMNVSSITGAKYKQPFIGYSQIFKFRGLESKIVFLCDLETKDKELLENSLYVGASRARNILHIFATKDTLKHFER